MTQPTIEELREEHNDAWALLKHSATHPAPQKVCDLISERQGIASDAYFQTKYKEAFELFGALD